jgi:hydrogenase expression/formation protein HypE
MDETRIQLAHGGGGQLTEELIRNVILPAVGGSQRPGQLTDAATLALATPRIAFTTDSYVVKPLEFPGGDIGKLSVCGTVNDLAVSGATPKFLSLALVLEEGLEIEQFRRVLSSAGKMAREVGVKVVTGDTKVVERGAVDGMIINTAGVGEMLPEANLGFDRVQAGDRVLLSGPLGEHGMAVMSLREGLSFSATLRSDCAALHELTKDLLAALAGEVRFLRDPTRGGLAAALADLASATGRDIEIDETAIPVNRTARAVAEMLGLDLLSAANEGKLVAVVSADAADEAQKILSRHEIARDAAVIGAVGAAASQGEPGMVELLTSVGGRRVIQMPYGEELPRIC